MRLTRSILPVSLAVAAHTALRAQTPAAPARESTAVFAAGCYWSAEAVFEHLNGVRNVVSGFAIPEAAPPPGPRLRHTSYAEAVRVTYDPSRITYAQLLQVFFLVAHDPTQVDRQGADVGPQYRSIVFAANDGQRDAARATLADLSAHGGFPRPIATEIATPRSFGLADDQDFARRNPDSPYVTEHIPPLLAELRRRFPALYHP